MTATDRVLVSITLCHAFGIGSAVSSAWLAGAKKSCFSEIPKMKDATEKKLEVLKVQMLTCSHLRTGWFDYTLIILLMAEILHHLGCIKPHK